MSSIIEMTTSPSLTMMVDTAQSSSTLLINHFDLIVIMFDFTIDTIVTAVVSSITVLLVMVIITSLVTVIICMKTSRQKSTPGNNGHKPQSTF